MAAGLRFALFVITLGCLSLFFVHPFWFPAAASSRAPGLDHDFRVAFWIAGALFTAAQILLGIFLSRRPSQSKASHGDWRWETAWTAAVAALFFWFHYSNGHLWSEMIIPQSESGAVRVEITGVQFQWYFRYPGPDGVFGRVDAQKFARPDEGNPLGLDPQDPAGKDDIVTPVLMLPLGHPAELDLRAQDVIHSVFIPAMRFKQDAVPGMDIQAHFTPSQIGNYELVCSQLCGLGHYRMRAAVRVVSEQEFKDWLKARTREP